MSTRVHPSKYFVPELPDEYIGNFGEHTETTEAKVLRLLLEPDTSTARKPVVIVKGVGGSGKTTALVAVGNHEKGWARFSTAIWFIVLGQDAHPSKLLENLQEVIRSVVGDAKADEIARLSRLQDKSSAVAEAIRVLKEHDVLLLLDDVWADEQDRVVGQSTVFSLVRDCVKKVRRNPGRLRAVVSTRDAGVAALVTEACRVSTTPFKAHDSTAKQMLCLYADVSLEDIEGSSSFVQESFNAVLDRCGGLPLALSVAGSVIRERTTFGGVEKDEVWGLYAAELEGLAAFLKQPAPQSDHPGLYAMVESSLNAVTRFLRRTGFAFCDEVKLLFSLLGVLRKQEAVPLSVVECIWRMSKEDALTLCSALARMHLVSLVKDGGVQWMRVHDLILGFCDVVLSEKSGLKALAHRGTVDRLEMSVLREKSAEKAEEGGSGCIAWFKLAHLEESARDYCLRNLARHMVEAGEEYTQRLLYLITDYRWIEVHLKLSKQASDLSGVVQDVQTFVTGCGEELDEDVKRGLELISDAARLSTQYVSENPQELPYQLQGRLAEHAGQNSVVDYLLWNLDRYATRPWLKAAKGVLTAAGGPVVLSASLRKQVWCVSALPNGEDVVVGGADGYLVVFSIRYASVLYELRGHDGCVRCAAACATRKRIFTGGEDGYIVAWELGAAQHVSDAFVRHERKICSIAVIADGRRLVFGDEDGWLVVCDSTSGDVIFRWRAHSSKVSSLAVRLEDSMMVSGSQDGTIGRWECTEGREIGSRLAVGGGAVNGVAVSRNGRRIAFAVDENIGVIEADTGDVLRKCDTDWWASCAVFGSDDETVHFGRTDGTTAVLAANGEVLCDTKTHSDAVSGIARSHESQLLVSVSYDCTLSVQSLDRVAAPDVRHELGEVVVLPDRKRILYWWFEGPGGMRLLSLDTTSPETALSFGGLINASRIIGSADVAVSAVAASRDGRYAVSGTSEGDIILYDTETWRPRYTNSCSLGAVSSAAISNNGSFLASGSDDGSCALLRLEDGSEVQLPFSAGWDGITTTVAFNEGSSSLLAMVRNESEGIGMIHIWKHIDGPRIEHMALPFSRVSTWRQPFKAMSVIANSSHIATRGPADSQACVYDFTDDGYNLVSAEGEDESGLLQVSNREHAAFESPCALFMLPFERTIKYYNGSDHNVLGTLEAQICHSFHPQQWAFDGRTGLFVAGGFGSRLLSAILMREDGKPQTSRHGAPKLPLVHKASSLRVGSTDPGTKPCHYTVFISHSGPDKHDIAIPLYRRLGEEGITAFADKEELRPGDQAPREMLMAMETADIGVFITSPEFVCRQWPMKELSCFLRRTEEAEEKSRNPPTVVPVFYRLDVHECKRADLFNKEEIMQTAAREGFFSAERQQQMPIPTVLKHLRGLTEFTGIENEENVVNDDDFRRAGTGSRMGRIENRMARDRLLKQIVDAVVGVQGRIGLRTGESGREGSAKKVKENILERGGGEVEADEENADTAQNEGVQTSAKRVARDEGLGEIEIREGMRKRGRF